MPSTKHHVPYSLNKLYFNHKFGQYEISESGIIYNMPFELTSNLSEYFLDYTCQTVADWYNSLSGENLEKVTRTGLIPVLSTENEVNSDKEWE